MSHPKIHFKSEDTLYPKIKIRSTQGGPYLVIMKTGEWWILSGGGGEVARCKDHKELWGFAVTRRLEYSLKTLDGSGKILKQGDLRDRYVEVREKTLEFDGSVRERDVTYTVAEEYDRERTGWA